MITPDSLGALDRAFCLGYEHAWLDVADGKYTYTAKLQERALQRARPLLAKPEEEKKGDGSRALADAARPKAEPEPTIDQLRDLRDYLVTIPPVLRNEATRFALGKVRAIISDAVHHPEAKPAERSEAEQESVGPFLSPREEAERILTERNASPQPKDSGAMLPTHAVYPGPTEASVRVYWCGGFANIGTSFPECAKGLAIVVNSHAAYRKALERAISQAADRENCEDAESLHDLLGNIEADLRSALSETGEG